MIRRLLLPLSLSLLLAGCGFQLRGLVAVPEALQTLTLEGDSSTPVYQTLERQLRANGIELVSPPRETHYRIALYSEGFNRRAASLNTRGKTEEYELRSQLRFEIFDRNGDSATGPLEVSAERTYRYDENNINAMQAEEALLRDELRQNIASQVIRRYLALATTASGS
ncbi:LPS assembly lipoprotein LptE [Motiliproteus sediminis]|uniref:LPS-assembly lipoprotein LptE n=1 Tax=Motiliproteus sediminis TaxID=1468178 RepID=UPI001AEF9E84|nr:LPS assembly lipoprotein LptE [Motiliproteus sediminis]